MTTKPRPRLDAKVDVRVSAKQYDAGYAQARAERVSLAEWVRRVLQAALDGRPPHQKLSDKH
jgi:predicted HicB family RNase H-like nuclease